MSTDGGRYAPVVFVAAAAAVVVFSDTCTPQISRGTGTGSYIYIYT